MARHHHYQGPPSIFDVEAAASDGEEDVLPPEEGEAGIRREPSYARPLKHEETEILSAFVRHTHEQMLDCDEDFMGRLAAMVATFGRFNAKQTFRFVASSCPGFVTGQFLARLQEAGVGLKPKYALQLVESGATSHDDMIDKILDLVEHGVVNVKRIKTLKKVIAIADTWAIDDRVRFARALGDCCGDKAEFLMVVDKFAEGLETTALTYFLDQLGQHSQAFLELDGDLKDLQHAYPELQGFFDGVIQAVEQDEAEADENGNLRDFVVADGFEEGDDEEEGMGQEGGLVSCSDGDDDDGDGGGEDDGDDYGNDDGDVRGRGRRSGETARKRVKRSRSSSIPDDDVDAHEEDGGGRQRATKRRRKSQSGRASMNGHAHGNGNGVANGHSHERSGDDQQQQQRQEEEDGEEYLSPSATGSAKKGKRGRLKSVGGKPPRRRSKGEK